jgi:hypothetical protein
VVIVPWKKEASAEAPEPGQELAAGAVGWVIVPGWPGSGGRPAVSSSEPCYPEMVRLPPDPWVIGTLRGWVLGEAGIVTCRTPSA